MQKKSRKHKNKIKNKITLYRRRMKLSQSHAAKLLGYVDSSTLSLYESGDLLPSLAAAFQLSILLRIPVEFLFPELYDALKKEIRDREDAHLGGRVNDSRPHSSRPRI